MEILHDAAQYQQLVKAFKQQYRHRVSNHYALFPEIQKQISENRLFYLQAPGILFFFQDEDAYWNVSFLADVAATGTPLSVSKPCFLNLLNKGDVLSEKNQIASQLMTACGFSLSGGSAALRRLRGGYFRARHPPRRTIRRVQLPFLG